MNVPRSDFGTELDELRRRRGLSWDDLAHRANVSSTYLKDISYGRHAWPSEPIVFAVAAALDVEPDYFRITRARRVLESPTAVDAGYASLNGTRTAA